MTIKTHLDVSFSFQKQSEKYLKFNILQDIREFIKVYNISSFEVFKSLEDILTKEILAKYVKA